MTLTFWIVAIMVYVMGIIIGFAWGCETGLKNKPWAEGFVEGFYAPLRFFQRK